MLNALQEIQGQDADGAENHHCLGVRLPVHLLVGIDAADSVKKILKASKNAAQPGRFAFIHFGDIPAERFGHRQHGEQVKEALDQVIRVHREILQIEWIVAASIGALPVRSSWILEEATYCWSESRI